MNNKDFPEVNRSAEKMTVDGEMESPLAREDAVQSGDTQETSAAKDNLEREHAGDDGSEGEINTLKQALEKKENEINELLDRIQRLAAEYDNYRKRTSREKERLYSDSVCDVVSKILPVFDNLERAIAADVETEEGKSLREGINMIFRQMSDILEKIGVKPIEAVGKPFDPELHNAVMHVEDDSYGDSEIIEEFQKGYIYKDETVIRHSMVKVAN